MMNLSLMLALALAAVAVPLAARAAEARRVIVNVAAVSYTNAAGEQKTVRSNPAFAIVRGEPGA